MVEISKEMIEAAKNAYWHEVHHGEGYSDKCYEAALEAALAALSSPPEPVLSVAEGEPDANAMRVIDPDQWEPCSPDWLNRGGDCACAPRVWNAKDGNHWHPKISTPPERRDAHAECGYGDEFNAIRNFDHDYEIGGDIEPQPASQPSDGELVRMLTEYRIVFDGFPFPDGPRFIEVEDASGRSIKAGEWRRREDGLCELVIKTGVAKNG